jgi:hypothetical protein
MTAVVRPRVLVAGLLAPCRAAESRLVAEGWVGVATGLAGSVGVFVRSNMTASLRLELAEFSVGRFPGV